MPLSPAPQTKEIPPIFFHTDHALHLVAGAIADLGGAATGISSYGPADLTHSVLRPFKQVSARKKLKKAEPHIREVLRLHAESKQWIAQMPKESGAEMAGWMALDVFTGGSMLGEFADLLLQDRLEEQRMQLSALMDELGQLHTFVRSEYSIPPEQSLSFGETPNLRGGRWATLGGIGIMALTIAAVFLWGWLRE